MPTTRSRGSGGSNPWKTNSTNEEKVSSTPEKQTQHATTTPERTPQPQEAAAETVRTLSPSILIEDESSDSAKTEEAPPPSNIKTVQIQAKLLPAYNVPEKIIFCLDRCEDDESTPFEVGKDLVKGLTVLKQAIKVFLSNKNFINARHQYALVVLNENNAEWLCDFTYFPDTIIQLLNSIKVCQSEDTFDLQTVFKLCSKKFTIPIARENVKSPPEYVVRMILLYNRSYALPNLKESLEANCLLQSPYFTLDVLYTHEDFGGSNHAEDIYNSLIQLDKRNFSYVFSVQRNAVMLFNCMAKLLAHPLQRPPRSRAE